MKIGDDDLTADEAAEHKGRTPYDSVEDARDAYRAFVQQGCDRDLFVYRSVDARYSPGFLIAGERERLVIGERKVEFVETLKLSEST